MARRVVLSQFYFDLCESYRLFKYLPHCAMRLWDEAQAKGNLSRSQAAIDAACFLIAQKLCDTSVFNVQDIAEVFGASEDEVGRTERALLSAAINLPTLRPDLALAQYTSTLSPEVCREMPRFFNLTLIGARAAPSPLPSPSPARTVRPSLTAPPPSLSSPLPPRASAVDARDELPVCLDAAHIASAKWLGQPAPEASDAAARLAETLLSHARDVLGVRVSTLAAAQP